MAGAARAQSGARFRLPVQECPNERQASVSAAIRTRLDLGATRALRGGAVVSRRLYAVHERALDLSRVRPDA
jgi:hypothetical protein